MCCVSKIFKHIYKRKIQGLPWWLSSEESFCQCRRLGFDPWVRKIPWRRIWQPTPGPVFTSYSAWGAGRTRGRAGESPAAAPGSRPARTIGVLPAGEGRRRRCLQAWRGLCALRWWLSLSDCSKAAEKSAAVPLPVEAAAAAAEDAHWRSQGAPRRSRPRPRSAPRSYLAPRRQAPHPSGSRRPGCAPGPGRKTERRLGLARRPHIWAWC